MDNQEYDTIIKQLEDNLNWARARQISKPKEKTYWQGLEHGTNMAIMAVKRVRESILNDDKK